MMYEHDLRRLPHNRIAMQIEKECRLAEQLRRAEAECRALRADNDRLRKELQEARR